MKLYYNRVEMSRSISKKQHQTHVCAGAVLEQGTGVEPALTAWEAAVIPIYQPCIGLRVLIITKKGLPCNKNPVVRNAEKER